MNDYDYNWLDPADSVIALIAILFLITTMGSFGAFLSVIGVGGFVWLKVVSITETKRLEIK